MFSNKNNKLIKKIQKAGDGQPMVDSNVAVPNVADSNVAAPMFGQPEPAAVPNVAAPMFGQPEPAAVPNVFSEYPNEDYLYDKITSQENQNNMKIYICAFTINKELDTHFVKYIVQQKDSSVTLPFFEFEPMLGQQAQIVEPQQAPIVEPQQAPMFGQQQAPMFGQQAPIVEPQKPPMFGQQAPIVEPQKPPMFGQQQAPIVEPQQQPIVEPQKPPMFGQQQQPMFGQQQQPMFGQQQPPMFGQQQPIVEPQKPPMFGQQQMTGGFKDDSNEEKDLDKMFKTKVTEFVKSIYQNTSEPSFIGYIPNISENGSIFAFVKIETPGQLNPEYIECIPNELVFLSKVYNFDIDQLLKDLFANNTWLYMKQSLASPFSGYICKQNEEKQFVNVPKEETANVYDQFLINHDGIGNYYYFSFLPIDAPNAETYQRFALFPVEYDCILDNSNLEYYKQNVSSFEQSDSLYFKDGVLGGQPFFALKTPTQFTKI